MGEQLTGIEKVRRMRDLFSHCNETFNTSWTFEELAKLFDAYWASGWDITPDRWTAEQLSAALRGEAPTFTE